MKRYLWWGWGGAFIVLMALLLPTYFVHRAPAVSGVTSVTPAKSSLASLLSLPIPSIPQQRRDTLSTECERSWTRLASWDMAPLTPRAYELTDEVRQGNVKWIFDVGDPETMLDSVEAFLAEDKCVMARRSEYDPVIAERDRFTPLCHEALASRNDRKKTYECIGRLVYYRAFAIETLMKGIRLPDIHDSSILANMLFALGLTADGGQAETTAKVAERLAEVDPSLDEAVLASLQFRYAHMRADISRPKDKRERLWAFDKALEEAMSRFERNEPSIFLWEMRMNRERLEGNLGELRRLAEKAAELWPASALGTYYLGWSSLLEGDKGTAQKYASLANDMDPLNLQFSYAHMIFTEYPESILRSFHEDGGSMSFYFPDGKSNEPIYGGGYSISPDMMLPSDIRVPLLEFAEE